MAKTEITYYSLLKKNEIVKIESPEKELEYSYYVSAIDNYKEIQGFDVSIDILFIKNILLFRDIEVFETINKEFGRIKETDNEYQPKPLIIIGVEKLFNSDEQLNKDEVEFRKKLKPHRAIRFIDSSIWNYYVSIIDDFESRINDVLKEIKKNEILYQLNVTKEYLELTSRMVENSRLIETESHSNFVVPFVFHSEYHLKQKRKYFKEDDSKEKDSIKRDSREHDFYLINQKNINPKWRILLIDDFGEAVLKSGNEINREGKNKAGIIQKLLQGTGFKVGIVDSEHIQKSEEPGNDILLQTISGKNCVAEAIGRIVGSNENSKEIYDIILLDYLLGEKDNTGQREYAFHFLKELDKKEKKLTNISTENKLFGKYWIMNISSFGSAMIDRMRERGYLLNDTHWNFFRGGDPISTPQLFLYNLFKLMNLQMSEAIGWSFDFDDKLLNKIKQNQGIIKDKNSDELERNRPNWIIEFNNVSKIFATYQYLLQQKTSEFSKSIATYLESKEEKDKLEILSHYRDLLYHICFHNTKNNENILIEYQQLLYCMHNYKSNLS